MQKTWWKELVVYQIYPRSFMDSNGDGVGDLPGIIEKLDYLQDLGVDCLWLCPMYKSPQDDNGYDISDYQGIHSEFGTMADFDRLMKEAHARGMRVIIDLVINHTSDEHEWFIESRSSKENSKRDWYIWRDPKNGHEPNNWESIFGGSAWKFDEKTGQFFMHIFSTKQPDLNWENLEMRDAVFKMIRWWLDKGIDGFRVDAISHAKKKPGLPDLPNPKGLKHVPSYEAHMNVSGIHEYLRDLADQTFNRYDIMTVAEANGVSAEQAWEWVGQDEKKFNMVIQFEHVGLWDPNPEKRIDLPKIKEVFGRWQRELQNKGWNALFVENHDVPRIVSKWGDPVRHRRESATAIATMYFLMQGTPFIYQAQELGIPNTTFRSLDDFNDVSAKNHIRAQRAKGVADAAILKELAPSSRDNARTPMPWTPGPQAGFTTGTPWLALNPTYREINVETERHDPKSVLNYYRSLIRLRKGSDLFVYGDYELADAENESVYAYVRSWEKEKALVVVNLTERPAVFEDAATLARFENLLLANLEIAAHPPTSKIELRPFEARVYRLS